MKENKREKTRKDLLTAAKGVVHEKGHETLTVRNLAEITGYSYTSLYYYFKDLPSLFWALRLEMIEEMIQELANPVAVLQDPVEEIIDVFHRYLLYFLDHPAVFRFFYFYSFQKPEEDISTPLLEQRFQSMWTTSFVRLIEAGIVVPDEVELAAKTIIYMLQGRILLHLSANGYASRESLLSETAQLIRYILNSVREKEDEQ